MNPSQIGMFMRVLERIADAQERIAAVLEAQNAPRERERERKWPDGNPWDDEIPFP